MTDVTDILIIGTKTHEDVCDRLIHIAKYELEKCKKKYSIIKVPGAFEIPAAISFSLLKKIQGYLVLGCIIKAETPHFDYICSSSISGISRMVLKHNLALGLGLITVNDKAQAMSRSDINNNMNYATVAVNACLNMIQLRESFTSLQ